jgi:hypothetical protein
MIQAISPERTLVLPEYSGQTVGLSWPLSWPAKDPHDTDTDYSLDISGWLLQIQDNVAVVQAFWEPNNPGDTFVLTEAWVANSIATVLASGGTPWMTYGVRLQITSQILGQVLSRTITLPVMPLYRDDILSTTSGMVSGVAM